MATGKPPHQPQLRLPLQQKGNHGVSDDPPKTLSSRFQTLSQAAAGGTAPGNAHTNPEEAAGARDPRGGRKTAFPSQSGGTSSPESFYWHPCRKSASPLSAAKRAMHYIRAERRIIQR